MTSGLSRPYFFKSAGAASSAAIDFICAVCSRPISPSTAPKSARACTGDVTFQSLPSFAIARFFPAAVMSTLSTLSRSNLSSCLSRRLNVSLFNDESW